MERSYYNELLERMMESSIEEDGTMKDLVWIESAHSSVASPDCAHEFVTTKNKIRDLGISTEGTAIVGQ